MKGSLRLAALAALVVLLQLPDSRTGLFPADEGWLNNTALRLSRGEALYRDVASYLPPLTYWILEAGMKIRPSLLWGRLLALAMCGAMTFAALRLLPEEARRTGALLLALLYAVGFPSYSIPSYTGLSLAAGFIALHLFLSGRGLAAGFVTGLALLFKQTTGAALLIVLCLLLLARWRKGLRLSLLRPFVGILLALVPAVSRMAWQGALPDFLSSLSPSSMLRYRGFGAVALPGPADLVTPNLRYTLPFLIDLFPAMLGHAAVRWLAGAMVFMLYYLPLPVCLFAFLRRKECRPLALFAGATYLTLFPRADLAHLFQVLPGTAVVLAALLGASGNRDQAADRAQAGKEAANPRRRRGRARLVAAMAVLSVVLLLHGYRAAVYDVPLGVPRDGGIRVRPDQAAIGKLIETLQQDRGPLLAVPWGSLYYFLSDRENPTRYELLLPGNIDAAGKMEVMRTVLERPPSQLVWSQVDLRQLTPVSFEEFFPDLVRFRDRRYEPCFGPAASEEVYCLKP